MYQPIRWDNINPSSLSEASRPLDAAARAFDMGFGAVRGVLDQRNQIQDQNFVAGRTNATNAILNRLTGITDVNAFKQAQQGLGAELDGLGAQVDQQAIRQFADQRPGVLQDRAIKEIDFNHKTLDEAQAKDRDRIQSMLNSGDKAQIDAAMKELPNMDLRVKQDLFMRGNEAQRQLIDRAHQDTRFQWDGQRLRADIAHMQNQDANASLMAKIAGRNAAVNERQVTVQEAQAMAAQQERLEGRLAKLREERMDTFKASAGSEKGLAAIQDAIKLLKDPNDQDNAREAAARAIKENPNATTESVIRGVMGMRTHWYSPDALNRQDLVNTVAGTKLSPAEVKAAEARRAEVDASINGVKQQLVMLAGGGTRAAAALGPTGSSGSAAAAGENPANAMTPARVAAYERPESNRGKFRSEIPGTPEYSAMDRLLQADEAAQRQTGPSAGAGAAPVQAAPALPPAAQRLADLEAQRAATPHKWGDANDPLNGQLSAARAAANEEARQLAKQQEADAKAAIKAKFMANAEAANKVNADNAAKQDALNAKAKAALEAKATSRKDQERQDRIRQIQSDIAIREKRNGAGDGMEVVNLRDELLKLTQRR